jgi:septal ring factor EnvC (AmiA/AmiB activator)
MLFEQTMWRGLASRLVRLGVPPYFAMQIAATCYPNGAKKAMQGTGFVFAPPIVSRHQAVLAVSRFEAAGPKGAPELFVPLLVVLFGQKRFEQWREELLQADAEAAADATGRQLEVQYEAALRELGLPPTASLADIQKQYKSLCRQFHPDRNQHEPEDVQARCARQMASINNAYEVVLAWLEIAQTATDGRRPPQSARSDKTASGVGPTPAPTPGPQKTAPSPPSPSQPKRSTAFDGLRTTALAGVFVVGGIFLLASLQTAVQAPRSWVNHGASSGAWLTSLEQQTRSLASRVRAAEEEVRDAEQRAAHLKAERTAAIRSESKLNEELKRIADELPRLETGVAACAEAQKRSEMAHRERRERFQDFCKDFDPVEDFEKQCVALARLVRQRERLTSRQKMAWDHVGKELQKDILTYLEIRDRLWAEERANANELTKLAAEHDALAAELLALRQRRTDAPHELSRSKKVLAQIPASDVAAAEAVLAQKVAACDRLKAQLVGAESKLNVEIAAARKRAAESGRRLADLGRTRKAQMEQAAKRARDAGYSAQASGHRQSADVPALLPKINASGRALGHLPPAMRTLILAEAAGLDTGVDLLPDEDGGLLGPPISPLFNEPDPGWPQRAPLQ